MYFSEQSESKLVFHSTKFRNFWMDANWTWISQEIFVKIRKMLYFRNANHSTVRKIRKSKNENQIEEKLPVTTFRGVLFSEMQTSICGRIESSLMRNFYLWESLYLVRKVLISYQSIRVSCWYGPSQTGDKNLSSPMQEEVTRIHMNSFHLNKVVAAIGSCFLVRKVKEIWFLLRY